MIIPALVLTFLLLADNMCESFRVPLRSLHRIATAITRRRIVNQRSATTTTTTTTRLFGTKRGIEGNPPGCISIYNDQMSLKGINEDAISDTISRISKLIGYDTYDVTVLLVDDEEMRETNLESRGINSPTDILSFPFHQPNFTDHNDNKAGLLEEPEFDIPDYYTLGDMVICVPYVIRRCQEDILALTEEAQDDDDESDVGYDDERGVSGAMADISDPEKRIRMLLVHGMLHLVGYDHIEDDDYIEMVEREEEILKEIGDIL
jgi:probable rRNA maturation factor